MREQSESDNATRRLLLGVSDEEEQQRIEQLFMTDPDFREKVLMAEADLIEEHLEGSLSEPEERSFRTHFLSTPEGRRKVRLARSLRSLAAAEVTAHSPPAREEEPQPVPRARDFLGAPWLRRPAFYVPMALALVAVVLFGTWRLVEYRRAQQLRVAEESLRLEAERELARLNDPSGAGLPRPGVRSLTMPLAPGNLRGASNRLPPRDESEVVELWLLRDGGEYQSYRATLQRVGAEGSYSIPGLRAADTASGRAVPVRIPARILTPGTYRLRLSGLDADGRPEELDEYTFLKEE